MHTYFCRSPDCEFKFKIPKSAIDKVDYLKFADAYNLKVKCPCCGMPENLVVIQDWDK